jgi:hypothetical protein
MVLIFSAGLAFKVVKVAVVAAGAGGVCNNGRLVLRLVVTTSYVYGPTFLALGARIKRMAPHEG